MKIHPANRRVRRELRYAAARGDQQQVLELLAMVEAASKRCDPKFGRLWAIDEQFARAGLEAANDDEF